MLTLQQRERLNEFIHKALFTGSVVHQGFEAVMESAADAAVERCQDIIKEEVRNFFRHRQQLDRPTAEELKQLSGRLEARLSGEISLLEGFTFNLTGENIKAINRVLKAIRRCNSCEENLRQETMKLQAALEHAGPRLVRLAVECHTPSLVSRALDLSNIASEVYKNINLCGLPEASKGIAAIEMPALEFELTLLYINQATRYLYNHLDKSLENFHQLTSIA